MSRSSGMCLILFGSRQLRVERSGLLLRWLLAGRRVASLYDAAMTACRISGVVMLAVRLSSLQPESLFRYVCKEFKPDVGVMNVPAHSEFLKGCAKASLSLSSVCAVDPDGNIEYVGEGCLHK